jgi:hypothetical protein
MDRFVEGHGAALLAPGSHLDSVAKGPTIAPGSMAVLLPPL